MGKKGQPGTHFNGKLQDKLEVHRSFCLYGHLQFKYILCKTFVSLNGKEGTTRDSFQWERSFKLELGVSGYMDILILNTYPARSSLFRDNGTGNTLVPSEKGRAVPELCSRNPAILA